MIKYVDNNLDFVNATYINQRRVPNITAYESAIWLVLKCSQI